MDWIKIGLEIVERVKKILLKLDNINVTENQVNVQTNGDLLAQDIIINFLKEKNIDCEVYSEELNDALIVGEKSNIKFIVDPIDNTQFFLRGNKYHSSIAFMILIDDNPKYAFVGRLESEDVYYCDQSFAYMNGKKISVPKNVLGKKLILGWAPYKKRIDRFFNNLKDLTDKDYLLFGFGGQFETVRIANGGYDAYVEVRPEILSEFCGALIAKRAGAIVTNTEGDEIIFNPKIKQTLIVARNKEIYNDILVRLKNKNFD